MITSDNLDLVDGLAKYYDTFREEGCQRVKGTRKSCK